MQGFVNRDLHGRRTVDSFAGTPVAMSLPVPGTDIAWSVFLRILPASWTSHRDTAPAAPAPAARLPWRDRQSVHGMPVIPPILAHAARRDATNYAPDTSIQGGRMNLTLLILFALLVLAYGLFSRRLEHTVITAPLLFTAVGFLTFAVMKACDSLPWLPTRHEGANFFLHVAEVGLVLLLFTDASRTDYRLLNSFRVLPARLLSVGMLLTMVLGALLAMAVFAHLTVWEAGILAAILAPTDAGLGQVIVTCTRVPLRIREALNVEAGLNDGLSVPFMLFLLAMAASGIEGGKTSLMQYVVEQLGYGALIGGGIGLLGGYLLNLARRRGWMA
ncbi:MAG: cation:proton antiporter, partial [Candidatus Accumulibacter sp.]